jgi:predicted Fe-S protein YdhL (DUF1289 family)
MNKTIAEKTIASRTIEARICPRVDSPCATPPAFARGQVSAFCGGCQKTVYNLSAMTASEQARVMSEIAHPCVRYSQVLPVALALALSTTAVAEYTTTSTTDAAQSDDTLKEVVMLGSAGPYLETVFLQTELDSDPALAEESSNVTR